MNLFFSREISNGIITLNEEESNHCNRVLRLKAGDTAGVLDGKGNLYECVIAEQGKKNNKLGIVRISSSEPDNFYIHIALAPTKSMDRVEWFIEKSTELGIREISFIHCKRSERKKVNIDRLLKISISALKQSRNRYLPQINAIQEYNSFINSVNFTGQKFIAHIDESITNSLIGSIIPGQKSLLLVGPEGDFENNEVDAALAKNIIPVSLGAQRFRTETAALVGLQTFILMNQIKR